MSGGGSVPISFSFTSLTPGAFSGLSLVSSDFNTPLTWSLVGDTITVGWDEAFYGEGTFHAVFDIAPGGVGAVPEPSTWAMMLFGFGAIGLALRRSRRAAALAA